MARSRSVRSSFPVVTPRLWHVAEPKPTYVLDVSVILKWFLKEEDSSQALVIQNQFLEGHIELLVPDLLFYEVANGPLTTGRRPAQEIKAFLTYLFGLNLRTSQPDDQLLSLAIRIASTHHLSVYDASYIALADQHHVPVVTADLAWREHTQDTNRIILLREWASRYA